jgi:hypothetical protein
MQCSWGLSCDGHANLAYTLKTVAAEKAQIFKAINQLTQYLIQGVLESHIFYVLLYVIKA